jgi:hypothetical protein
VNGMPMEWMAKNIDSKLFLKNKNNLLFSDAILFGQAGMLNADFKEDYPRQLKKEYKYLEKKYDLKQIDPSAWKFGRLRPPNFPTLRIAQLSGIMANAGNIFDKIISAQNNSLIKDLFLVEINPYWQTHYRFGKISNLLDKKISNDQIDLILINMVAPLVFYYAQKTGNDEHKNRALEILEQVKSEKNSIISQWKILGIETKNAFDSQALIQLKKMYCDLKRCLECRVGHSVLQNKA